MKYMLVYCIFSLMATSSCFHKTKEKHNFYFVIFVAIGKHFFFILYAFVSYFGALIHNFRFFVFIMCIFIYFV